MKQTILFTLQVFTMWMPAVLADDTGGIDQFFSKALRTWSM
jgi:hypothetical protein